VNNNTESLVYGKLSDNKFDGYFMINAKYYYIEPVTNLKPESIEIGCSKNYIGVA
jgi:hypothetical protein